MIKHPEVTPCCATCEWSSPIEENDELFYCHKKKRERPALRRCRRYTYDLLKHTPPKQREITTLDPTMIEI